MSIDCKLYPKHCCKHSPICSNKGRIYLTHMKSQCQHNLQTWFLLGQQELIGTFCTPPPKRWSSNILTDAIVNYCSIFLRATTPLWFVAGGDLKPYPNDPKCISLLELDGIGVITCNGPRHVYLTDIVYLSFPQVEVVNPTKNSINLINPTYIH